MVSIQPYQSDRDHRGVRDCIVELQDYERSLESFLPAGEAMADDYLAFLLRRCEECEGRMLVALAAGEVVGFVCVLTRVPPAEPDEGQADYAYISALIVRAAHRRRGLGRRLLEEAELWARSSGASDLRVGVLAKNRGARELYASLGFAEFQVHLTKPL
jgi:ribosomal protein S18 acetylase RimI-like enzyme